MSLYIEAPSLSLSVPGSLVLGPYQEYVQNGSPVLFTQKAINNWIVCVAHEYQHERRKVQPDRNFVVG